MVKLVDLHCGGPGPKTITQRLHKDVQDLCPEKKAFPFELQIKSFKMSEGMNSQIMKTDITPLL